MKKLIYLQFLLLSSISAMSQSLVCNYNVKVDSTYLKEKNINVHEIFYTYTKYLDKLSYKLTIKDGESHYAVNPDFKKGLDENLVKVVQSVGGRGVYYFDKSNDKLLNQKFFFGEIYLIEQEKPTWNYTDQTKVIDGIMCFKAFSLKKIDNGKRQFTKTTIAWYAPSLPYSFGPMNFIGLPGLIIELQENEAVLYLDKIEFLNSDVKINAPTEGIRMTDSQYEKHLIENGEIFLKNQIFKN